VKALLNDQTLEQSEVVANAAMNRERGLLGVNSYAKDLAFDPFAFLQDRLAHEESFAWLDLCCGTGKALVEAAARVQEAGWNGRVSLLGVDLVPMFRAYPPAWRCLRLVGASVTVWEPENGEAPFDLITCVHGLHYVGDKLGMVRKAISWLKDDGLFLAHLDPVNLRWADGAEAGAAVLKSLRRGGLRFDRRRRLLSCAGWRDLDTDFAYLGADDRAGPSFTGQPAVHSHYGQDTHAERRAT